MSNNTTDESVSDLEFYGVVNNCVEQYMSCKNTVAITNPDIDCLQWGKCQHLSTLDALMQVPYVKNTLANNSQLNINVNNTLSKYGKNGLSKQLNTYNSESIVDFLTDLISELNNQDPKVLSSAGISLNSIMGNNY